MKLSYVVLAAAAMAMGSLFAGAGFSYQGRLVDEYGAPITNRQPIAFSIYGELSGGTLLWQKVQDVAPNAGGTFSVELSGDDKDGTTLSDVLSTTDARYLELGFLDEYKSIVSTVTPRQKILPVPSATYAQNVSEAKGDFTVMGETTFCGDMVVYGDVNPSEAALTFSQGKLAATNVRVGGNATVAGGGTFDGKLDVNGDLTVCGNVTMESTQGGTTFTAKDSDFKVRSLRLVGGGLTVNGLKPGVPIGMISIWSGGVDSIPDGWAICDGNNGTLDLRGRFIVGAGTTHGQNVAGDGGQEFKAMTTGGKREVTLTTAQMPSHYHLIFGDDQLAKWMTRDSSSRGYDAESVDNWGDSAWFKTRPAGGNSSGGTDAHANLPPYMALFYIQKIR